MDNTLLENGIQDDRARLMTLIGCLCCEASAFKLLAERLIDRYNSQTKEDQAKEKVEKEKKSEKQLKEMEQKSRLWFNYNVLECKYPDYVEKKIKELEEKVFV